MVRKVNMPISLLQIQLGGKVLQAFFLNLGNENKMVVSIIFRRWYTDQCQWNRKLGGLEAPLDILR